MSHEAARFLIALLLASANSIGLFAAGEQKSSDSETSILARLAGHGRVKVEGTFIRGTLVADKIALLPDSPDTEFEIEGVIDSISRQQKSFAISQLTVLVDNETVLEDNGHQKKLFGNLRPGIRVKIRGSHMKEDRFEASLVRIYPNSRDSDFELESNIESFDSKLSEILVLSIPVRITRKTQMMGEDQSPETIERGIRREEDEPQRVPLRWGRLALGGKVGVLFERARDLDEERVEEDWLRMRGQIELSLPVDEHIEAYAKFNFNSSLDLQAEPGRRVGGNFEVREAFLDIDRFLHRDWSLRIGRQRFRDRREWIFDDQLDAIRLEYRPGPRWQLQTAIARRIFRPTLSRADQFYFFTSAQYRSVGRRFFTGYLVKRNDSTVRDEDPVWFGLSSQGPLRQRLSYWLELSTMRGRQRDRKLRGYAVDLGASYRFKLPWGPTLSAGYARGSGDASPGDGLDGNYRQTDLQDNNGRQGSLKRYRYYGVLAEPELSNLEILTLDLGLGQSRRWSLNGVFHRYRQAEASRRLGGFEVDRRPSGLDPALGNEFDLIFAFKHRRLFDVTVLMGAFRPGPAFPATTPSSLLLRLIWQFYF